MTKSIDPKDLKPLSFWEYSSSNKAKYKTPRQMENKIKKYFTEGCRFDYVLNDGKQVLGEDGEPLKRLKPTVVGLSLYLGFKSRSSLYEYKTNPAFTDLIEKVKSTIEMYYEENLMGKHVTGSIFALKNMGWSDNSYIESDVKTTMQIEYVGSPYEDIDKDGNDVNEDKEKDKEKDKE